MDFTVQKIADIIQEKAAELIADTKYFDDDRNFHKNLKMCFARSFPGTGEVDSVRALMAPEIVQDILSSVLNINRPSERHEVV